MFVADRKNAGHIGDLNDPSGRGTEIEIDSLRWQVDRDARVGRTPAESIGSALAA